MPEVIYWHMQMNQPWGSGGGEIDSSEMLEETPAVIGTGNWENRQYNYFTNSDNRALKVGDVVLIREGVTPLALCKIISDYYEDANLTTKYHHQVFRKVKVISFYKGHDSFPMAQGTLNRLVSPKTTSWKFINNWYTHALNRKEMEDYKKLMDLKKQIILQGPPGTGKTYTAQDLAYFIIFDEELSHESGQRKEQLKVLESNEHFQFVQFHPSYTYEDFVRGITAKPNGQGIVYQAENKLLGKFAKDAYQNLLDSNKSSETISKERWVKNKIYDFQAYIDDALNKNEEKIQLTNKIYIYKTDENGIRYRGDNWQIDAGVPFSDLTEMFMAQPKTRDDIKNLKSLTATAKWNSTYWLAIFDKFNSFINALKETPPQTEIVSEKKYVLIIDEINRANLPSVLGELIYALEYRDHNVQSMYELEVGGNNLVLPSNLYIIGTMNTADRSVGHIDYAIRRRFAFVAVLPNESIIKHSLAQKYFNDIKQIIAKHRASDFEFNDIMLGHSYFLASNDADLKMKMKYDVYPILKEYIKDGLLNKNEESVKELETLYAEIEKIDE